MRNLQKEQPPLSPTDKYNLAFANNTVLENKDFTAELEVFNGGFMQEKNVLCNDGSVQNLGLPEQPQKSGSKNQGVNGALSSTVIVTVCVDYYLKTDVYNWAGNIVGTEMTYLGRECYDSEIETTIDWIQPEPSGGGPVIDSNVISINFGEETSIDLETTSINDTTKYKSWQCYSAEGGAITFKSYELIKAQKYHPTGWDFQNSTAYSIQSITHIALSAEGNISGQDITPVYLYSTGDTGSGTYAKMTVVFKDKRTWTTADVSHSRFSGDKTAWAKWPKESLGWATRDGEH